MSGAEGWVKICGLTRVQDAEWLAESGADAIGLNRWPRSPRYVSEEHAYLLTQTLRTCGFKGDIVLVGVGEVDSSDVSEGKYWQMIQLHAPNEGVAYDIEGLRLTEAADVGRASKVSAKYVLVDGDAGAQFGGSGKRASWEFALQVAQIRPTILAGGLNPTNVASAIDAVLPWGVDVASGVETAPGIKSREKVLAFVEQARHAFLQIGNRARAEEK